ncbi:MAG: hypothetical protein AAB152_12715 [Candidatus Coatesbacteria bacterium]
MTKATIYLDAKLRRTAKVKAAQTNNTLSAVNDAPTRPENPKF